MNLSHKRDTPAPWGLRRDVIATIGACVIGAAVVLLAASQPWARAVVADLPGGGEIDPTGGRVAPVVSGLGLGVLAGAAAIVATRGIGRILVGVFLVAAGLGIVAGSLRVSADPSSVLREPAAEAAGHTSAAVAEERATAWPFVAALGGALATGAGVGVAARGRRWPTMSARYERQDSSSVARRQPTMWDAIGRGDDPTV